MKMTSINKETLFRFSLFIRSKSNIGSSSEKSSVSPPFENKNG